MDVALIGEGTYPHQFGGVSVWCDQLVRGMPDYDFVLVALVATGAEPIRWSLPENVASVHTLPLWGPPPAAPASRGRGWRRSRPVPCPALADLIDILLAPPAEAQDRFGDVLREIFEFAQTENLTASLSSDWAVSLLSDAWRDWRIDSTEAAPTLHDAVMAMQLLEHSLRPLSHPPVRADVVHAVTNGLGALPAFAAKWRYGTPMVVTEHGIYMREQYLHSRDTPYRWPVRALNLRFLRRLCTLGYTEAEMITPGNVYNKRWEEQLGADLSRVRTVYNGVDPADFPASEGEPAVPTISWAGRVDPIKDLETLLLAFALVHRQMPEARLRMFGAPPQGQEAYLERCKALAADLGLSGAASFEGRVEKIRDAYDSGQVVVLCSITEGFPYTLIEAMTCGRPCVATDVGGVSEAVGDTGMIVPPRNPEALAQSCLTLLRDPSLRRQLGAAARMRALEYFTVDRAISAFDEIYTFVGTGLELPTAEFEDESDDLMAAELPERDEETELLEAAG
jgi:glycosyltransferase involved in cell wall biosynthesis